MADGFDGAPRELDAIYNTAEMIGEKKTSEATGVSRFSNKIDFHDFFPGKRLVSNRCKRIELSTRL